MDEEQQIIQGTGSGARPLRNNRIKRQAILTAVSPLVAVFFGGSAGVNIIPPLICWLVWKDANPLVDKVRKEYSECPDFLGRFYTVCGLSFMFDPDRVRAAPVVVIAWIVFSIIAAVKAANGNYDYCGSLHD